MVQSTQGVLFKGSKDKMSAKSLRCGDNVGILVSFKIHRNIMRIYFLIPGVGHEAASDRPQQLMMIGLVS